MTLNQWLDFNDLEPSDGLCLTFGTDGLNPNKDQLMSISYNEYLELPETIYVKDPLTEADAASVEQYTGVCQEYYMDNAVYFNEALDKLSPVLEDAQFIVTYNYRYNNSPGFYKEWSKHIPDLKEIPILDLPSIFKLKDRGGILRQDIDNIKELNTSIEEQVKFIQSGYSISYLTSRFLGSIYFPKELGGTPDLEKQPYRIMLLYEVALQLIL